MQKSALIEPRTSLSRFADAYMHTNHPRSSAFRSAHVREARDVGRVVGLRPRGAPERGPRVRGRHAGVRLAGAAVAAVALDLPGGRLAGGCRMFTTRSGNFGEFERARSRLYRSRFLQQNSYFKAFFEIYKICIFSHTLFYIKILKN